MNIDVHSNAVVVEPLAQQAATPYVQSQQGSTAKQTLIARWLNGNTTDVGQHSVMLLSESPGTRACVAAELNLTFRHHYMSQETWSKRIEDMGAPETAKVLQELLPNTKQARSGDTGEILATEVSEEKLSYKIPIRRLRWKDGRNAALRGDDIVGVAHDPEGEIQFLKEESKSRVALSASTINEASEVLDRDMGQPNRYAILFIANRLREQGKDDLATELEKAFLLSFNGYEVEHLLFVVSGNDPGNILTKHLAGVESEQPKRYAIGVWIPDHGQFIEELYDGL